MNVTRAVAYGSISEGLYGAYSARSEAHGSYSFKNQQLKSHLFGNNDAATELSSDIDVFTNLNLGVTDGSNGNQILKISGKISGDKFPAAEAYVSDAKGNALYLGVSPVENIPVTGPYKLLPGKNKRDMMEVDISISVNKDGIFEGVMEGGKLIPVKEWNGRFETKNPKTESANNNKSSSESQ